MRYCTLDDLQKKIPPRTLAQLTNDTPPATAPNLDLVEEIVAGQEELVDGYLRQRNLLPLAEVPTIVRDVVVQLVRYEIYDRRPEGKDDLPPAVVRGRKDALQTLDDIRAGRISLGVADDPAQAQPEAGARMRTRIRGERLFTPDLLNRYR
ncbi:conserved hypothetical protein [Methylococcus capsulatus str. Bath]|uniref:DUF1320 domain-containing protein n=3 Tax=Methylococcus TaxID=413 RepID=Q602Y6_METCA|nr:DUF1320 domain-containing protein [Methylococcus capsulatus]AAU90998.1 conserved hypothetical protein [Methylococcus capsulatus str. Bath]